MQKQTLYDQIRAVQNDRNAVDTVTAIRSNTFIQQQKTEIAELQGQQAQLSDKLGSHHPEMLKLTSAIQQAETKLQAEIGKIVASVKSEYEAATAQEKSLAA